MGQTILLHGSGGTITRSTDGGASFAAVPSGTDQDLWESVVSGQTILLHGSGGAITRSTDGGASFTAVPSGTDQDLWVSVVDGQTILLYGDGGAITRSTDGGASFAAVLSGTDRALLGSIVDGQTILLHGGGGAITRSTNSGASFAAVLSGTDWDLSSSIVVGQAILLFGGIPFGGGTIIRSTDGGASFTAVLSGTDRYLSSGIVAGQAILLYGDGGEIIRLSDDLSILAAALSLPTGAEGDTALLAFLDGTLPGHIRNAPPVQSLRQSLLDIQTQRRVLNRVHVETQTERERLDRFPYSLLLLGKQREDFASFMAICRGTPDAAIPADGPAEIAADAMTLACLSGWQDQRQSETESWWQTLAVQVPPGILLLFLLSTLAALYRYNLRLAGFHHSRADALELMAMGKTKEDIEQLASIAVVLAADKVIFGKSDDATRQAAELHKAVRGSV